MLRSQWTMRLSLPSQYADFFKDKGNVAFKAIKLEKALEFYEHGKRLATVRAVSDKAVVSPVLPLMEVSFQFR
eukprot:COSAG05_NODE_604_length_8399_cov_6.936145_6_plen_73_part_00